MAGILNKLFGDDESSDAERLRREAEQELRSAGPGAGWGGGGSAPPPPPPAARNTPPPPSAPPPRRASSPPAVGGSASSNWGAGGSGGPAPRSPAPPPPPRARPAPARSSPPVEFDDEIPMNAPLEQPRTLEDERRAVNDFALEQYAELRGSGADTLDVITVDTAQSEMMRDRALAEYLERRERIDRERREYQRRKRMEQEEQGDGRPATKPAAKRLGKPKPAPRPAARAKPNKQPDRDPAEVLEGISGLGPAKLEALLEEFPTLDAIAAASAADLKEVKGIGPALAKKIKQRVG